MPKIVIAKKEVITDKISKISSEVYEIPNVIKCTECGNVAFYDPYEEVYRCQNRDCKMTWSAKDFVTKELERAEERNKLN